MQLLFHMFSTLMSLEDRLRLKLKVKYMAIMLDHPCVNTFIYSHVGLPGHVPSLKDLAYEVIPTVYPEWVYLAILLGLEMSIVKEIEKIHPRNDMECCLEMFNEWLRRDDTASWSKLVAALRHPTISKESLAARLERDHPCMDTDDG